MAVKLSHVHWAWVYQGPWKISLLSFPLFVLFPFPSFLSLGPPTPITFPNRPPLLLNAFLLAIAMLVQKTFASAEASLTTHVYFSSLVFFLSYWDVNESQSRSSSSYWKLALTRTPDLNQSMRGNFHWNGNYSLSRVNFDWHWTYNFPYFSALQIQSYTATFVVYGMQHTAA